MLALRRFALTIFGDRRKPRRLAFLRAIRFHDPMIRECFLGGVGQFFTAFKTLAQVAALPNRSEERDDRRDDQRAERQSPTVIKGTPPGTRSA